MRRLIGVGTPRGLQGRLLAALGVLFTLIRAFWHLVTHHRPPLRSLAIRGRVLIARWELVHIGAMKTAFTTAC